MNMVNEIHPQAVQQGEIILYQPDETVRIEVRLEDDTVWLTQQQMAELFQKDQSVIARHIGNVFREGELNESSNMQILHNTLSKYKPTKVYNLNVIISVGYRVKSMRGTKFRQWATSVIREHLLHGYAIQQQLKRLEQHMDEKLGAQHNEIQEIKQTLSDHQEKIDFFVRTNQPPVEGGTLPDTLDSIVVPPFYDGQIFDAYRFVNDLVRKAKSSIVLIDDEVYHIGASLKNLGKKWFAFTLMHDLTATELITRIGGSATVNILE